MGETPASSDFGRALVLARGWHEPPGGLRAGRQAMHRRVPIGEILVQRGRIDARQLGRALHYQKSWGCRLGKALVTLGFLGEDEVLSVVAQQLDLPYVEVGDREVPIGVLR